MKLLVSMVTLGSLFLLLACGSTNSVDPGGDGGRPGDPADGSGEGSDRTNARDDASHSDDANQSADAKGGPCATGSECSAGYACLFAVADGCSARGACLKAPTAHCGGRAEQGCGCDGKPVFWANSDGSGTGCDRLPDDLAPGPVAARGQCQLLDAGSDG